MQEPKLQDVIDDNAIGGCADIGTVLSVENMEKCFERVRKTLDKDVLPPFLQGKYSFITFHKRMFRICNTSDGRRIFSVSDDFQKYHRITKAEFFKAIKIL